MEVQVPSSGSSGLRRAAALAAVALCGAAVGCGSEPVRDDGGDRAGGSDEVVLTPEAAREGLAKQRDDQEPKRKSNAQVVELQGAG